MTKENMSQQKFKFVFVVNTSLKVFKYKERYSIQCHIPFLKSNTLDAYSSQSICGPDRGNSYKRPSKSAMGTPTKNRSTYLR